LVIIGVSLTLIIATIYLMNWQSDQNLEIKRTEYLAYLSETLELPLWNYDIRGIEKIADGFAENDFISRLIITDSEGKILINVHKDIRYQPIIKEATITHEKTEVGRVEIGLTPQLFRERDRQFLWASILYMSLTVMVIVAVSRLLLYRLLKIPIDSVVNSIEDIARGNYCCPPEAFQHREIRCIMSSVTAMACQVANREKSLKEYEQIVATSRDLMSLIDRQYVYRTVNDAYLQAHQRQRDQIVGKSIADLMSPSIFENTIRPKLKKCFAGETVRYEIWFDFQGWGRRFMDVIYYPARDESGNVSGAVVNSRDMTETKQLEEKLIQVQKMESIGTLAGGIAHDFNNLLMSIQGYTTLMMLEGETTPRNEKLLKIETIVKSGANLTQQLLGLSRGGKYEVRPSDVKALMSNSAGMFGRTRKEIRIYRRFPCDLWNVDVDRNQIEQVLVNLYINAWQAMPDGGELFLEAKNTNLDEGFTKPYRLAPGRYVGMIVRDTGAGMDPTVMQRVFDPFFTTKSVGRGTGLGLSSAYGIIKNHDGIISVHSKPGQGSTFTIYLPASDKPETPEVLNTDGMIRGTAHILVVDDEDMVLEISEQYLKNLGYTVFTARSGYEALDIYSKEHDRIDLVMLDMIMPDMSGKETFEKLKAMNPDVKILLSSGYSRNGQADGIMQQGGNGFIQKPFNLNALSVSVNRILNHKRT